MLSVVNQVNLQVSINGGKIKNKESRLPARRLPVIFFGLQITMEFG